MIHPGKYVEARHAVDRLAPDEPRSTGRSWVKEALVRAKYKTIGDRRKNQTRHPFLAFWIDRGRLLFDLVAVVTMCAWRERQDYLAWTERHDSPPEPPRPDFDGPVVEGGPAAASPRSTCGAMSRRGDPEPPSSVVTRLGR